MKYSGFVYEWTNKVNGKKYIGSHKGKVDDGYIGSGTLFLRSVEKYGLENFERVILEYVEDADLIFEREQYHLDKNNVSSEPNYYNLREKTGGGFEYINNNPILVQQNTERLKTMFQNIPHPRGMLGKTHSKENIEKTRRGWEKWANENLKKEVYKFTLTGEFVSKYSSLSDAAKSVGAKSPSNIKYTCEGKFTTAHGYLWSYENKAPDIGDPLKTNGKKKVHTPDGTFDSVTEVMKYYKFSSSTAVRRRCLSNKHQWKDWYYLI